MSQSIMLSGWEDIVDVSCCGSHPSSGLQCYDHKFDCERQILSYINFAIVEC